MPQIAPISVKNHSKTPNGKFAAKTPMMFRNESGLSITNPMDSTESLHDIIKSNDDPKISYYNYQHQQN